MSTTVRLALLTATLALVACDQEFEPPDRGVLVREADAIYTTARFDSVDWASEDVRLLQGNEVYAAKCRRCHGTLGKGETEYARGRALAVPSLVEEDWPLADLDSIRHRIFVGHEEGMPIYGVGGITDREIDAAAYYVLRQLRADVLNGGGR